jgi:hypothetical protein
MKISRRTDIHTLPFFDVRSINDKLIGEYDHICLILTTLENEPSDAWEQEGDSFLLINIPKQKVLDASIDYKKEIIENLPKLRWLPTDELLAYINERWN